MYLLDCQSQERQCDGCIDSYRIERAALYMVRPKLTIPGSNSGDLGQEPHLLSIVLCFRLKSVVTRGISLGAIPW